MCDFVFQIVYVFAINLLHEEQCYVHMSDQRCVWKSSYVHMFYQRCVWKPSATRRSLIFRIHIHRRVPHTFNLHTEVFFVTQTVTNSPCTFSLLNKIGNKAVTCINKFSHYYLKPTRIEKFSNSNSCALF